MNIVQWNIQGYNAKFNQLKLLIKNLNPICIALQEMYLGRNDILRPPSEYIGFKSKRTTRLGAGILIKKSVPATNLPLNTNLQAVAVRVQIPKSYTICSLYIPPREQVSAQDINQLLTQLPAPIILMGDFNSRHPLWGDRTSTHLANEIIDVIDNYPMELMNDGTYTHYHAQTLTSSCIDLTLVSPEILMDFSWSVVEKDTPLAYESDHFPIVMTQNSRSPSDNPPRWIFDRADWPLFNLLTETKEDPIQNITTKLELLTSKLKEAAHLTIPISHRSNKPSVPWWNLDCERAIKNKKTASRKKFRTGKLEDYIEFKRLRAIARKVVLQAKREHWKKYITSISSETPLGVIWKKVQKINGKFKPQNLPLLLHNGNYTASQVETANVFAERFSEISSGRSFPRNLVNYINRTNTPNLDFSENGERASYNKEFSSSEYTSALNKCRNSAAGPDDIYYEMLKNMHHSASKLLLKIFNEIWRLGQIPQVWKEAIIIPIAKHGKDPSSADNYRPISLTSCVGKLLEKMVATRLSWFLESNNILSNTQFGFRQALSTTNPILNLQSEILQTVTRGNILMTVFFDLTKAYDTTWRRGLINDFHEMGLRGRLAQFMVNFLKDRSLRVKVGSTISNSYPMNEGIPQGSVLSVLCFGIAINGISNHIPNNINHNIYVDDISISKSASRPAAATRQIQLAIDNMVNWASLKGYTFSQEKTVYMIFRRNRRKIDEGEVAPTLNGVRIRRVREHKFLGMYFDERLSWTPHIKYLKDACNKPLSLLSHLSHTTWGTDRKTLTLLYNSLVQSKLDYGCQAYGSAAPSLLKSLDVVRNKGLRLMTGAFRSSPIISLHADVNMLPPDLNRTLVTFKWYLQMQQRKNIPLPFVLNFNQHIPFLQFYYHLKQIINTIGNISIAPIDFEGPGPWMIPEIKICRFSESKKDKNPLVLLNEFLEHAHTHRNSIEIYTDGSKSDRGVGAAAIIRSNVLNMTESASLHKETSIFSAEIIAISFATKLIDAIIPLKRGKQFTIYCDSLSALQALSKLNPKHPEVSKIQKWLFRAHDLYKIQVNFCWSPGHIGIAGNEQADSTAKDAIRQDIKHYQHFYRTFIPAARRILYRQFQERWDTQENNKLYKIKPKLTNWASALRPRREDEVLLCRLRIGHTHYTHSYLMDRSPRPRCSQCNDMRTSIDHIFSSCRGTERLRRQLFPNSFNVAEDERLQYILAETNHFDFEPIREFIINLNIRV